MAYAVSLFLNEDSPKEDGSGFEEPPFLQHRDFLCARFPLFARVKTSPQLAQTLFQRFQVKLLPLPATGAKRGPENVRLTLCFGDWILAFPPGAFDSLHDAP